MTFGSRYAAALSERGRLCAGIDPHASLLHAWGLDDDVAGLERFALTAVEALAPHVPVIKPQSAFYERFGSRGVAVLERVIAESRAAGALVLLDAKRGDIGSTSQAYADAYLDPSSPLACDAVTVSAFLGFGSLTPFVETAAKHDAGLFVLALTSNKEGPEVQHATVEDGRSLGRVMLDHLRRLNDAEEPLGSFGAVVGATIGGVDGAGVAYDFGFNGPILAPGFGQQGGTPADLARIFGAANANVVASTSRGLLRKGPDTAALRDEALRLRDELG
ncbi:orotidine-5'-phosphate decarboxylase [Nocardioides albertanoniae]|uniref:Orotidine-5'-phosphate decarboxylase n=1 Tax=Nocardioides albertanoniae TaxID=1175486 RepID=A0A543A6U3_9ACTN|nr:orotidine-5'-phosphate decarboxylase [Nocardioides albertanoniae]TQL68331.1 orotidine-5'-phosphate decarboxylase [Nocardioides albertanoniae]